MEFLQNIKLGLNLYIQNLPEEKKKIFNKIYIRNDLGERLSELNNIIQSLIKTDDWIKFLNEFQYYLINPSLFFQKKIKIQSFTQYKSDAEIDQIFKVFIEKIKKQRVEFNFDFINVFKRFKMREDKNLIKKYSPSEIQNALNKYNILSILESKNMRHDNFVDTMEIHSNKLIDKTDSENLKVQMKSTLRE